MAHPPAQQCLPTSRSARRPCLALVALLLLGGAWSLPVAQARGRSSPQHAIQRLLSREQEWLPEQVLVHEGRELKIEAAAAPQLLGKGAAARVQLSIGTAVPLECSLAPSPTPLSTALANVRKALAGKRARPLSASVVGYELCEGEPLAVLEFFYVGVDGESGGLLKLAVLLSHQGALVCQHDEVGYRSTFRRIGARLAKALLGSGGKAAQAPAPDAGLAPEPRRETWLGRMGDTVGQFVVTRVQALPDGGTQGDERHMALSVRGPGAFTAEEERRQWRVDPKGRLIEARFTSFSDGRLEKDLALQGEASGGYRYSGRHSKKRVGGRFQGDPTNGLRSLDDTTLLASARDSASSIRAQVYLPELDFGGPTQVELNRDPSQSGLLQVKIGRDLMRLELDKRGEASRTFRHVGAVDLVVERVFRSDTP